MLEVKSVSEVFQIIRENFSSYEVGGEFLDIGAAAGRITVAEVMAPEDVPGFSRSSVDGYAVFASDIFGASDTMPAQLELVGEVVMGEKPAFSLKKGQTAYVPTGGELPGNVDAMVMVEYTEDFQDGFIYINKSASPGNSVVFRGDDAACGSVIIGSDRLLRPQDIGALAAIGYGQVRVKSRIKVGIISTGDELVEISEKPNGAKVRDVNSHALCSAVLNLGGEPVLYGIISDDFLKLSEVAMRAVKECDIVLISGGSSAGTKDETRNVIDSLGSPGVLAHGIAVKPGKPTILGNVNGKAVFGLPGHPASALMIFRIFVGYLFDVIYKVEGHFFNSVGAVMECNYPSNNGREEFLPVRLKQSGVENIAAPVFGKSGLLSLLTAADGYVHISRGSEGLTMGQKVEVILF